MPHGSKLLQVATIILTCIYGGFYSPVLLRDLWFKIPQLIREQCFRLRCKSLKGAVWCNQEWDHVKSKFDNHWSNSDYILSQMVVCSLAIYFNFNTALKNCFIHTNVLKFSTQFYFVNKFQVISTKLQGLTMDEIAQGREGEFYQKPIITICLPLLLHL